MKNISHLTGFFFKEITRVIDAEDFLSLTVRDNVNICDSPCFLEEKSGQMRNIFHYVLYSQ